MFLPLENKQCFTRWKGEKRRKFNQYQNRQGYRRRDSHKNTCFSTTVSWISLLSFGVRNYAHLTKNAFKIFASLTRRCKPAKGKVVYAEKSRPLSFTYGEKKIESIVLFARKCRLIERIKFDARQKSHLRRNTFYLPRRKLESSRLNEA